MFHSLSLSLSLICDDNEIISYNNTQLYGRIEISSSPLLSLSILNSSAQTCSAFFLAMSYFFAPSSIFVERQTDRRMDGDISFFYSAKESSTPHEKIHTGRTKEPLKCGASRSERKEYGRRRRKMYIHTCVLRAWCCRCI